MNIVIIDAQGGGIGRALTAKVKELLPEARVIAVGANAMATAAMLKAGADAGATGENAVKVACARADLIMGPIGILLADAMLGEITPEMARAVGAARAERILVPVQKCETHIAGVPAMSLAQLVEDAARIASRLASSSGGQAQSAE